MRWMLMIGMVLLAVHGRAVEVTAVSQGAVQVGLGAYDEAVAILAPLLPERAQDGDLHYWLGRAYLGQSRARLAVTHLAQAYAINAGDGGVVLWYGRALVQASKLSEALTVFDAFAARNPEDTVILAESAATRMQSGDYPGARAAFATLKARDPSPENQARIQQWTATLDGLATRAQLEPTDTVRTPHYTFVCDPGDEQKWPVIDQVDAARATISTALGNEIDGFRVLMFPTWATYERYARIYMPQTRDLHATAFALPGTLVLWSPATWPAGEGHAQEFASTLKHELVHLAIAQLTGGEGVPLWLNEGLACHYGGWSGAQDGHPLAEPLTPSALNRTFLAGDRPAQQQAYTQAHAMATVLVEKLGDTGVRALLTALAGDEGFPDAYRRLADEPFPTFLAEWPARAAAKRIAAQDGQ